MTTADRIVAAAAADDILEQIAARIVDATHAGSKSDRESGAIRDISDLLEREGYFDDYCLQCYDRKSDCECTVDDDGDENTIGLLG